MEGNMIVKMLALSEVRILLFFVVVFLNKPGCDKVSIKRRKFL